MNTPRHAPWHRRGAPLWAALLAGCTAPPAGYNASPARIRGQVVSRVSGQPVPCGVPLVVLAIPQQRGPAPTTAVPVVRRVEGAFAPPFVVVAAGRTVRIVNEDEICHRFFSSSEPNAFDLGLLKPGESGTVRFGTPGTVHVYCSLHAGKQATVLVAPTAHFAVVGRTGEFEIENFAPGAYVLETWSEDLPPWRSEVTVPPRRTKFVEIPVDELLVRGPE